MPRDNVDDHTPQTFEELTEQLEVAKRLLEASHGDALKEMFT